MLYKELPLVCGYESYDSDEDRKFESKEFSIAGIVVVLGIYYYFGYLVFIVKVQRYVIIWNMANKI